MTRLEIGENYDLQFDSSLLLFFHMERCQPLTSHKLLHSEAVLYTVTHTPGDVYRSHGQHLETQQHQAAVISQQTVPSTNFLAKTAKMKANLLHVATGSK